MAGNHSAFTQAIEDHLALKKQNAHLEPTMPIARFNTEVGDPLDRYPGGPVGQQTVADEIEVDLGSDAETADAVPGDEPVREPSPEPAILTPSLSLVDDLDRNNALNDTAEAARQLAERYAELNEEPAGDVVRFPGGAGPREAEAVEGEPVPEPATVVDDVEMSDDAEQTMVAPPLAAFEDEPRASVVEQDDDEVILIDHAEPFERQRPEAIDPEATRKRRWFGLGRNRKKEVASGPVSEGGWFSDSPRGFSWDD